MGLHMPVGSRLNRQRGFSYIAMLAMVALLGVALAAIGPLWAEEARREREDDLLRVGRLYAEAIAQYRQASPGSASRYPASLDALVLDTRFVGTVRHLRVLYPDPLDPTRSWGLVRDTEGGIQGVFSRSDAAPLRTVAVELGSVRLPAAARYSDWRFVARAEP
jgi:type II secretory pathway pseudopilin PulG